ncbi:MAG: YbdD/YjiX family protein, partial [Gemmatimonadaceae bacterium]
PHLRAVRAIPAHGGDRPMSARVRASLSRWAAILRAVAGVPDYARYLAHMRAAHPRDRIMTETEFNRSRLVARYDSVGSRCC